MITLANATVATATFMALICFFYGPWQRAAEDLTRQFIFERRARLFMLACEGKLSFDSESYKNARLMLNAFIRFAHDLSWPRLVFHALMDSEDEKSFGPRLTASIKQIEDLQTRKAVSRILHEASASLIFMMAMKSILLAVPVTLSLLIGLCTKLFNQYVTERIDSDEPSVVRKVTLNVEAQAAKQYGLAKTA
jgi:hypothetical protein